MRTRRAAGWKPKTNTPAVLAARERLAEKLRGVKRKPEHIAAMLAANESRRKPKPEPQPCGCGCGAMTLARYIHGHNGKGKRHTPERCEKMAEGMKKAHERGAFEDGCKKRRQKTLAGRPKCKCGCGLPVGRRGGHYAPGCFDATTPENRAKALQARDWKILSPQYSKQMAAQMKEWKDSGKLEAMRHKAGIAKGMPDHIAAKQWHIRSPRGLVYKFSNLAEWSRRHQGLFVDDRPESKAPFWLRIAGGITDLLKANGRSCSYRGWVAVSKSELVNGAPDLLGRDVSVQNDQALAQPGRKETP
jgi:hypothetical protein